MVDVRCNYFNAINKNKDDYFIYTDIEVTGHSDALDMHHTTGIKVCAGISACCYGIRRLVNDRQFNVVIKKGYFHIWTNFRYDMQYVLDKETVYALNTLVCQLYELYRAYPNSFKSFNLVDVKEIIEDEQRKRSDEKWSGHKPRRPKKRVGLYSTIEDTPYQEN